ncbi:MAG: hypothetical protein GXP45_03565 [bacterium]|nr:hypothetical protein [bacterium]
MLIGSHLDELVQSRRSHLNSRFHITDFAHADAERREKIFDGASVLIEYNPSLWSDLPP